MDDDRLAPAASSKVGGRRMSWDPNMFPEVIAGQTDAHPFELSGEELSHVSERESNVCV